VLLPFARSAITHSDWFLPTPFYWLGLVGTMARVTLRAIAFRIMNRKLLIQVTAPAILLGLLLLAACLAGAWYTNRLQRNFAALRNESVTSLQAAEELEIALRQLRFHGFLYLIDPTQPAKDRIQGDHEKFEQALQKARTSSPTPEQAACLAEISEGYLQYQRDLEQLGFSILRACRGREGMSSIYGRL
jgi:hypothetical protein